MTREDVAKINPNAIVWDEGEDGTAMDKAIIGMIQKGPKKDSVVLYSIDKLILILMEEHPMTAGEAHDWYEFNIGGAYVGELTPQHVWDEELDSYKYKIILK